jgi:hypothetical protein
MFTIIELIKTFHIALSLIMFVVTHLYSYLTTILALLAQWRSQLGRVLLDNHAHSATNYNFDDNISSTNMSDYPNYSAYPYPQNVRYDKAPQPQSYIGIFTCTNNAIHV